MQLKGTPLFCGYFILETHLFIYVLTLWFDDFDILVSFRFIFLEKFLIENLVLYLPICECETFITSICSICYTKGIMCFACRNQIF